MREVCPLSKMVLPGNFKGSEYVIAVQAGDGSIVYVFKDALTELLCKIGVEPTIISQIRHKRPGEIFEGIEELVKQVADNIGEVAMQIAKRTKKAVTDVIAEVRSLLERLIKSLNLNISPSPA